MTKEELRQHCERTVEVHQAFKNHPNDCSRFFYNSKVLEEHQLILDLIKQTEWIPITNEDGYCTLPDVDTEVLVTYYCDYKFTGRKYYVVEAIVNCNDYGDKYLTDSWDDEITTATAWMPKPEPYKGE